MKKSVEERFFEKVDTNGPVMPHMTTPCHVWIGATSEGYGHFRLDGKTEKAHVVSFGFDGSELKPGQCVLHHCDNRPCIRRDHLYAGTKKNNAQDREVRGRSNHATGAQHGCSTHPGLHQGEKNGRSKLDVGRVREIKLALRGGEKKAVLARRYGVSKVTMGHIESGKLWGHVEV